MSEWQWLASLASPLLVAGLGYLFRVSFQAQAAELRKEFADAINAATKEMRLAHHEVIDRRVSVQLTGLDVGLGQKVDQRLFDEVVANLKDRAGRLERKVFNGHQEH